MPCTPMRTKRNRKLKRLNRHSPPPLPPSSGDSSDYLPVNLKQIFEQHFQKRKKKKKKKRRIFLNRQSVLSLNIRKQRLKHKGLCFPFATPKYLTFKMYFPYEQSVVGGFLQYVKNLKCNRSLKESLKNMGQDDELEDEMIDMRKYKYLDDDGSISPISEPGENTDCEQEEVNAYDAKVVENSTFILNCNVPSKKNWCIKKKKRKPKKSQRKH
ncbi:TATA box-binding protein-associated factor RNA polymerase I subunit D [Bombina bombina]|uniref:TATA box-binding protein-associated factor RNA polymerase I subunit D n=1 Tax=Bombina bombina TaxID=8345 RepID=UPI00235ADC7E|nr:TATA box-binding protein-associated factor RNA polymerase I subunit D [Bombina bombina]